MKLYVIIIGRKDRNPRYVTTNPFCDRVACTSDECLAVFEDYQKAQLARKQILKECGHSAVYIIPFVSKT